MKKIFLLILLDLCAAITVFSQTVTNGIPWYDKYGKPVSAHGANIIRDGGRYYMFGEYKTDSANIFTGFSCYSSDNLSDWHFEGIAFSQQKDGRMGPNRVGERPKVLKCPKTGEYIMLMHTDNMQYKDPCTCYATSRTITGPYEFQGPILYKGKPVTKWDIGSFVDDDGHAYLLVHHGMIYRLSEDFHSLDSCLMSGVKGAGESPAMMKKDGIYYWMSSHTTSWERNDNMYWTATSLGGPWTYRGEFCPVGSLTWNSQCSFLLTLDGGRWMYMGDRWSFPRQHQAATYVWLPVEANKGKLSIPEYMESWDVFTGKPVNLPLKTIAKGRTLRKPGDTYIVKFNGTRIGLKGNTDENSGYAEVTILDGKKQVVFQTSVDFYSNAPATGLRWLSPVLPNGKYTLQVRCSEMKPNWTDKKRIIYGSKGHKVEICEVVTSSNQQRQSLRQSFLTPPDSIRVGCYYYWINERVDPKGVVADLKWMKDNGITLAFLATDIRDRLDGDTKIQIYGKNKFQSRLWWKNLRTALKTAGELGIEMGIFNCPGWSQSGGPWIKPEEAMRNWTPNGIEVCKTKQGTDVVCSPCSPEATGLEVDKLSKTHVKKHFEAFFGEILRRIPAKDRPTLTTVVVDSWERGKQNYTDSIFVKFRQRFGYDLDYQNDACKKDLDRLIAELVASEYMGGLTEKAHEYGLRTWCEPYAHSPFPANSISYGSAADEVAAEFWVDDKKFRQKEIDAAVGAARKSGKNRVWAESFTDGWPELAKDDWSFEKLKPIADRYFHAGINASILHVVISQPGNDKEPAVRPWFGTYFDRRSQNAADIKPLVQYLRRCNFMLQLGKPYNNATDQRIMNDGTIIRFTDDSQFEVTFPDGSRELWNPHSGVSQELTDKHLSRHNFFYAGQSKQRRMFIVKDGQVSWSYQDQLKRGEISDAVLMTDGHILVAHQYGVAEIDADGQTIWQYTAPEGTEIHTAQPIGRTHVVFVQNGKPAKVVVMEIPSKRIIREFELPISAKGSVHGQFRNARLSSRGTLLVANMALGCIHEYTSDGKEVDRWKGFLPWSVQEMPKTGNLLITGRKGIIQEINRQGQTVWQLNTTSYGVTQPQKTIRLKNGNHIINNWYNEWNKQPMDTVNAPVQAIEVDKEGKVVWQLRAWKAPDLGPSTTIQLLDEAVKRDRLFFGEFNAQAPKLFVGPNEPIGIGRGIYPGRVAWVHSPGVAKWDGKTGLWVEDRWNDQAKADAMIPEAVKQLTGETNAKKAWSALFKHFNKTHGRGNRGYKTGESIAIKLNLNNAITHHDTIELNSSPFVTLALVRSMVRDGGIRQQDIVLCEPSRAITDSIYNKIHREFPLVRMIDNIGGDGREKCEYYPEQIVYSTDNGKMARGLAKCIVDADYLINSALLKTHSGPGVTLTAKNWYGATDINLLWRQNAHNNVSQDKRHGKPGYKTFVDWLSHKDMGQKALLYLIDGTYGSRDVNGAPNPKWMKEPFNGDWACSLIVSQDELACDAVGMDIIISEWPEFGSLNYCDEYLREAASIPNTPSGIVYKQGGKPLTKPLGLMEHCDEKRNYKKLDLKYVKQ